METLHEWVFGRPIPLIVGLIILALPLGYVAWRQRGLFWLAPAGSAGLAGLLLLLSALFPSDRLKIDRLLGDAAGDVREGRWQELGGLMTGDFQWLIGGAPRGASRDETLAAAQAAANPLMLKTVKLHDPQLAIAGPSASVTVHVTMVAGAPEKSGRGETLWRFTLARQPDGRWLMRRADLLELDGQPAGDSPLRQLVGGG